VGVIAGVLYLAVSNLLIRLKLDDVVDAVPVHLGGGVWGILAVGLLSEPTLTEQAFGTSQHPGFFYSLSEGHSDARLLACQVIGLLFVIGWNLVTMTPFFLALNAANLLRTHAVEEIVGLDMIYGEGGKLFPDNASEGEEGMRDEFLMAYEDFKLKNVQRRKSAGGASSRASRRSSHRSNARSVASSVAST